MVIKKIDFLTKFPFNWFSVSPNYSLLFPYKSKNDYVIITHGMPSLTAVTVCMWIKTNATGNRGTLLSYAVSGQDNELLLLRPRDFVFSLRSVWRYENTLSLRNRNDKLRMMCRTRPVLFESWISNSKCCQSYLMNHIWLILLAEPWMLFPYTYHP